MFKKILALFVTLIVIPCFNSCVDCNIPPHFQLNEVRLSCIREIPYYELLESDSVPAPDLLLKFNFINTTYHAHHNRKGGLIQSAYATTCEEKGYQGTKDAIEKITVIADQPFDQTHAAGTSLNDLLETLGHWGGDVSLNDMPDKINEYNSK